MFKLGAPSCDTGIQELPEIAHYARAYFYFLPKFGVSNNVKQFSLVDFFNLNAIKMIKMIISFCICYNVVKNNSRHIIHMYFTIT